MATCITLIATAANQIARLSHPANRNVLFNVANISKSGILKNPKSSVAFLLALCILFRNSLFFNWWKLEDVLSLGLTRSFDHRVQYIVLGSPILEDFYWHPGLADTPCRVSFFLLLVFLFII